MADTAVEAFSKGIRKQFDRNPVWLPGTEMRIGDIGTIKDGEWQLKTSLAELETPITFKVRKDKVKTKSIVVDSGTGVEATVNVTADADVLPLKGVASGNAGIGLSFSSAGQFSLRVYGVLTDVMENVARLESEMLNRFLGPDGGDLSWDRDWVVVTEVMTADRGVVAVSSKAGAEMTIDLGVDLGAANVRLGEVTADASVGYQSSMASAYLFTEPTAVMFRARRVKSGIFSSPEVTEALRHLEQVSGGGQVRLSEEWTPLD